MRFYINYIIILLIISIFNNCASRAYPSGGDLDSSPPQIIKIFPEKNSKNISKNESIQIIFNELLDPGTVNSSVRIEPHLEINIKYLGNKIIINPKDSWSYENFKVIISRNLSDYSTPRNKLSFPIEILYSTSSNLDSKFIQGSLTNADIGKTYEVAILDNKLNILSKSQSDNNNTFSISLFNQTNDKIFVLAVEERISDNIKKDIRKRNYAISSDYIGSRNQKLYISPPIYQYSINTIKLINNNFGFLLLNNGEEIPFLLNNIFFQGLINQLDNFYYFDYNYTDSLYMKINLSNNIENYTAEINTFFKDNKVDTVAPLLSGHFLLDENYRLIFSEPVLFDSKEIFSKNENKEKINYKYISPLEVQLNDTSFKSLNINCKSIKDLSGNFMCDSIVVISSQNENIQDKDMSFGEINGTINYTGNKPIIIEAINLDNDLVYRKILDSDKFLFDKLTPGNYNILAFEHLNKVTMNYFSGRLEPLELAAKYVEYNNNVAVRANWKNTINIEIK